MYLQRVAEVGLLLSLRMTCLKYSYMERGFGFPAIKTYF